MPHYAKRYSALKARMIEINRLLRKAGTENRAKRKREAPRMCISNVTSWGKKYFSSLDRGFANPWILLHLNPDKRLYADLDSPKYKIGAMIYHSEIDPPTQKLVQPIMFLSCLFKPAEENYWLTELEVEGLLSIIAKIRHLIEYAKHPTIIYTDHQAAIQIATQISLTTTLLVRLSPGHNRSSEYISRFKL